MSETRAKCLKLHWRKNSQEWGREQGTNWTERDTGRLCIYPSVVTNPQLQRCNMPTLRFRDIPFFLSHFFCFDNPHQTKISTCPEFKMPPIIEVDFIFLIPSWFLVTVHRMQKSQVPFNLLVWQHMSFITHVTPRIKHPPNSVPSLQGTISVNTSWTVSFKRNLRHTKAYKIYLPKNVLPWGVCDFGT